MGGKIVDVDVVDQLNTAYEDNDSQAFKRLLREHPEHMRNKDGTEYWMWMAAMQQKLPILQAVVELGIDVNESHDDQSAESSPFFEPEGPILQAASGGDYEITKWLLDHGARNNYTVNGKPRCLPLIEAATQGHLEVVKLLIEHGADFRSTWNGLNAMSQAEEFGHVQIRDYLQSLQK